MSEVEPSDEELVERARSGPAGDSRAFETLVKRHQRKVVANCRYLTGSTTDVDDLAQEVFTKAYFGLGRFEGRSLFSTWIKRIKVNHVLNHLAKRRGKHFVDIEDPALEGQPDLTTAPQGPRQVERFDQRQRIAATLDGLTETLRVPLVLRDADGLSYREIADQLGVGLSAVKMRIKRAREEFRALYEGPPVAAPVGESGAASSSVGDASEGDSGV